MESNNKKEENNQRSFEEVLNSILEEMGNVLNIKSGDIPNIDLYMDQVLSFLDEKLNYTRRSTEDGEEKIFTKTMINNYAKNNLLIFPQIIIGAAKNEALNFISSQPQYSSFKVSQSAFLC